MGPKSYNLKLSKARARAVKQVLVDQGAAAKQPTTVGYGMERPVASNKRRQGRAINQRAEFKLLACQP